MKGFGPPLELLLRRLSECPPEFIESTRGKRGADATIAIACDLIRNADPNKVDATLVRLLTHDLTRQSENARTLASVVAWLLDDESLLRQLDLHVDVPKVLSSKKLRTLAEMVPSELTVSDPDRREELVRIVLAELELRPAGESIAQASDRLNTLDSVERHRVLTATAAAEKRARKVREAMARKKAMESASRFGE